MNKLVMGLGQKILTRVRSIFCCSGQVGSGIFDLGLRVWKISPKNHKFSLQVKKIKSGWAKK